MKIFTDMIFQVFSYAKMIEHVDCEYSNNPNTNETKVSKTNNNDFSRPWPHCHNASGWDLRLVEKPIENS